MTFLSPRSVSLSFLLVFVALCCWFSLGSAAEDEPISFDDKDDKKVEIVADQLEYDRNTKKMIGRDNVVVTYGDLKMSSDYAEVQTETKQAYARGHVILLERDQIAAKGEEVHYNFESKAGKFPNGSAVSLPWFVHGREVEQKAKGKWEVRDGIVTTCERTRPHYQLRAKTVDVFKDDKIFAKNVTVHILGKKVFWLPFLIIPLQEHQTPIEIQVGYSDDDGAYILTSKGFSVVKQLWGNWHIDYRSKRGFGAGLDLGYHFEKFKEGDLVNRTDGMVNMYLTQDERAPNPNNTLNPYEQREDRERGRITWKHRTDFYPDTYLLLRFHKAADEFFLQDFFEQEFRSDVEPTSFVNFTHNSDRYGFYAFNQKQVNEFDTVTERLPEIRFDWKNAPFFTDRLYYESNTSFANLNQTYSRTDQNNNAIRGDTFHEWTFPLKWREITLTPSANFRETLYSRDKTDSDFRARTAVGGAVDLRTQFYRTFETSFDVIGIEVNQLRHVFEPYSRYDTTLHSSVSNEELHKFDSVDSVDDANKVTFGLENRIQTKRVVLGKIQRVDLVSLNTFMSYDFHPDEAPSGSGLGIIGAELQIRPYEWLQYEVRFEYDVAENTFRDFNQDLLAQKNRFRFVIGHRLVGRRDFLNTEGNNQFVFEAKYWLNNLWAIGGYLRWDAEVHELEEWQISATRDLHDFLLDFGYNVRNSEIDESNKEFFFLFHLKAFPRLALKSGNRASFSEPRIGITVAGSDQFQDPSSA